VANGTDPIADEELLFRRIPVSMGWYAEGRLSPEAFGPRKDETTGISVYRAMYKSIDEVAMGKSRKGYYVAVLRTGDLRNNGIEVVQTPPDDPGHAELPDLNANNRREDATLERQRLLTELCISVEGPFQSPDE
jgi:hypothetical protein